MRKFNRDSKRESGGRGSRRSGGRDSGRFGRGDRGRFGRRDSGRSNLEMHTVTCDKCGEKCEVPFKPTEGKPVFCSDCFKKNGNSGKSGPSSKDLDKINKKLDKIMQALEID